MGTKSGTMRLRRGLVQGLVAIGLLQAILVGVAMGEEGGKRTLPRLDDASAKTEVTGQIADSTRGKPGPVRLVLRLSGQGPHGKEGEEIAVLVAPDAECDRLDLSLGRGEEITVIGHLMAGAHPLLVAQTIVSNGRRVEVR